MSYICGGNPATSGDADDTPADLHGSVTRRHTVARGDTRRVVPDLYRHATRILLFVVAAGAA